MKLNVTCVPYDSSVKEFKFVCYGDRDSLDNVLKGVNHVGYCTNVYMTEEKKDEPKS